MRSPSVLLSPSARRAPLAVLTGAVLTLALAACGGDGGSDTTPAGASTTPAPTATTPATTSTTTGQAEQFNAEDWPLFGRDRDNTRYAPQTQINTKTVRRLGEAWSSDMGGNQFLSETFPIMVDGVLYVTTSSNEVYAYDAKTGKVKWKYTPDVDFSLSSGVGGYGVSVNRGVAVSDGMVYLLTYDCQLKGISASTGEEVFSSQVDDPSTGAYETMSPTVYDGQVFVGNSGSDEGVRGFVAAYDAKTGKQNWRFWTIPPVGEGWRQKGTGGGTVYMAPTIDTQNDRVLFGTANPSPAIVGTKRPGNNLYTSSVVALDIDTGKLAWYRQEVPHDLWDYDAASPVMLFDSEVDGKPQRFAVEAGKIGQLFMLDADTGKDVFPRLAFVKQDHKPPTTEGTLECPGPLGGAQYSPLAYSPQANAVYVSGIEYCFILTVTDKNLQGESNFGGTRSVPSDQVPSGTFDAVDMSTGTFLWRKKMDTPMSAGATTTAGGLVFTVDQKGILYAFDAKTGDTKWKTNLGLAGASAPISYEIDGKQYIALTVGGSGLTASNKLGPIGSHLFVLTLDGKKIVPAKPAGQ